MEERTYHQINMGGNSSRSPDDSGEEYEHTGYPRQGHRINTADLLNGISNKCKYWSTIISNMKLGKMPDDEAKSYILGELRDTKEEIDVLVEDLSISIVSRTQQTYAHGKPGQQHERKKPGKVKPPKLENQVVMLQERLEEIESVKEVYVKHNRDLTTELAKEMNILKKTENERQEVLLRLSQVTGDKLKTDNPNVSDLSDPNRPTKLGEMISELYDNEWTDAFEGLQQNGRNDRGSIRILLETFMDTYAFCCNERIKILGTSVSKSKHPHRTSLSVSNKVRLKRSTSTDFLLTNTQQYSETDNDGSLHQTNPFLFYEWLQKDKVNGVKSKFETNGYDGEKYKESIEDFNERLQHLKSDSNKRSQQLLKEFGEQLEPLIEQTYLQSSWTDDCINSLQPYIRKCLYVSWMMCIQMPPMTMAEPAHCGATFCSTTYKQYTVKGPIVDYIVWPAVLLHENGPVISKGVAQGKEM